MRSAAMALADALRSRSLRLRDHGVEDQGDGRHREDAGGHAAPDDLRAPAPAQAGGTDEDRLPAARAALALERSSKPQWGHVRVGTSVIVGGIGLTSVDIVTGSCQSPASWTASTPARQPAGRPPAPGRLAFVQAFLNTFWDLDGDGAESVVHARRLRDWLRARGFAAQPLGRRPRPRARAARGAARTVPANHDDADAPAALAVLDRIAHAVAPARRARAEPAHRRARARGRRPRRGVRAGPGDRLRRARRRHLRAAQGVPARALRLGLLRRLAQPLGAVVLDAHLRQPHQGRGLPGAAPVPADPDRTGRNRPRVGGLPSHHVHDRLPDHLTP